MLVAFLVTQTRFYDAHQKAHQDCRTRSDRIGSFSTEDERRAMFRATFQRDANAIVERARRTYLLVLAAGVVYLLAFPVIVWISAT